MTDAGTSPASFGRCAHGVRLEATSFRVPSTRKLGRRCSWALLNINQLSPRAKRCWPLGKSWCAPMRAFAPSCWSLFASDSCCTNAHVLANSCSRFLILAVFQIFRGLDEERLMPEVDLGLLVSVGLHDQNVVALGQRLK